jgi:hypothetical protein
VNPQAVMPEKIKYLTENRLKLELGVSEEFISKLKRAQEILSQKKKTHINFEAVLGSALEVFFNHCRLEVDRLTTTTTEVVKALRA